MVILLMRCVGFIAHLLPQSAQVCSILETCLVKTDYCRSDKGRDNWVPATDSFFMSS